ncbi:protein SENESCENCE-ASSOCIATED GENE 21, mitochondrial-like [Cucurbita maxima]|uniref:Protein SENESCENCE-ASSOCIATED GENE 21, mitochondrial-like n=1 Tax=Cucurbita maxima TaxID=3661 RepID=A0A6J1K940_CUCMA|nr:protein SENESCENCE-ASSOCIATED GENE 21, mitochondrial-like [Cucurbita maxima]
MARSFSAVKIASALVSDGLSNTLFRRGYAAVAPQSGAAAKGVAARIGAKTAKSTEKESWVPDPVTGYYRPENCAAEIDAVDLRAILLKATRK